MNSFAPAVFDVLEGALDMAGGRLTALVLANDDARAFSVGADLSYFLGQVEAGAFDGIAAYLARGATAFLGMKNAPVPVVASLCGFALGGGCEWQMHCDAVVAHGEAKVGLPEIAVGIIPGWGGCTQLVLRAQHAGLSPEDAARRAFGTVFSGARSNSAAEARELGLLSPNDRIAMHHDHVLRAARDLAVEMAPVYRPRTARPIVAAGAEAAAALVGSLPATATATDRTLAARLAWVLTGGGAAAGAALSEADMMALERQAVRELSRFPSSQERMAHMMKTGKQLRN